MRSNRRVADLAAGEATWPVLICLLGDFRLLKAGRPVALRSSTKTEALLRHLALRHESCVPRDALLETLWPNGDAALAAQSLNSLVYSLSKLLGDAIGGDAPVTHSAGGYRLNAEAGVGVDVACFDALADRSDQQWRAGDLAAAAAAGARALDLYRGDLDGTTDIHAVMERERLRARYLNLLARLADYGYSQADYAACAGYALKLLTHDPCREDAHRLVMRCYVRQGVRAQALRQYQLCQDILRAEFDAEPEPATTALFEQIRLDPASV